MVKKARPVVVYPDHSKFVIAGGYGVRPDSEFCLNQYPKCLKGKFFTLNLKRKELDQHFVWKFIKPRKIS